MRTAARSKQCLISPHFFVILSEVEGPLTFPPVSSANNDYWVYVVSNNTRSTLYIGVTGDLKVRIWQHRKGERPDSFAQRYQCGHLIHVEHYRNIRDAIAREKQ